MDGRGVILGSLDRGGLDHGGEDDEAAVRGARDGGFETVVIAKMLCFDLFKLRAEFVELCFSQRGFPGGEDNGVFNCGVIVVHAGE